MVCPLCGKRISNWESAGGKTTKISGHDVHRACVMQHDVSVAELEQKVKDGLDPDAGWRVGFYRPTSDN